MDFMCKQMKNSIYYTYWHTTNGAETEEQDPTDQQETSSDLSPSASPPSSTSSSSSPLPSSPPSPRASSPSPPITTNDSVPPQVVTPPRIIKMKRLPFALPHEVADGTTAIPSCSPKNGETRDTEAAIAAATSQLQDEVNPSPSSSPPATTNTVTQVVEKASSVVTSEPSPSKRKRGRPRKYPIVCQAIPSLCKKRKRVTKEEEEEEEEEQVVGTTGEAIQKKKRGRPRKNVICPENNDKTTTTSHHCAIVSNPPSPLRAEEEQEEEEVRDQSQTAGERKRKGRRKTDAVLSSLKRVPRMLTELFPHTTENPSPPPPPPPPPAAATSSPSKSLHSSDTRIKSGASESDVAEVLRRKIIEKAKILSFGKGMAAPSGYVASRGSTTAAPPTKRPRGRPKGSGKKGNTTETKVNGMSAEDIMTLRKLYADNKRVVAAAAAVRVAAAEEKKSAQQSQAVKETGPQARASQGEVSSSSTSECSSKRRKTTHVPLSIDDIKKKYMIPKDSIFITPHTIASIEKSSTDLRTMMMNLRQKLKSTVTTKGSSGTKSSSSHNMTSVEITNMEYAKNSMDNTAAIRRFAEAGRSIDGCDDPEHDDGYDYTLESWADRFNCVDTITAPVANDLFPIPEEDAHSAQMQSSEISLTLWQRDDLSCCGKSAISISLPSLSRPPSPTIKENDNEKSSQQTSSEAGAAQTSKRRLTSSPYSEIGMVSSDGSCSYSDTTNGSNDTENKKCDTTSEKTLSSTKSLSQNMPGPQVDDDIGGFEVISDKEMHQWALSIFGDDMSLSGNDWLTSFT